MHYLDLPVLGVGLSADVAAAKPNFRKFLDGTSPQSIDYLNFGAHHVQLGRVKHYIDDLVQSDLPLVFHPNNWNTCIAKGDPSDVDDGIRRLAEYTDCVWAGQDVGVWTYENHYLGGFLLPALLDEISINETVEKVRHISKVLPCPFLVENPPVVFPLGTMHMIDFMAAIARRADCGVVLDVGHLLAYHHAAFPDDPLPLDRFPFERVVEVHLAGLQTAKIGAAVHLLDQHALPVAETCWEFLETYMHLMVNLKGLTLEQEFCEDAVVEEHLARARDLVLRTTGPLHDRAVAERVTVS